MGRTMGTREAVTERDTVLTTEAAGRRRPSARRELELRQLVFAVHAVVASRPEHIRIGSAREHGEAIYNLERALGIDVELSLNRWLADQGVVRVLANYEYAITYVASAMALLVWLFLRHPEHYRMAR